MLTPESSVDRGMLVVGAPPGAIRHLLPPIPGKLPLHLGMLVFDALAAAILFLQLLHPSRVRA